MKYAYDLQLFSEDEVQETVSTETEVETEVEEETEPVEVEESAEEPKEEIPEDLLGLPEDIARETLEKAKASQPKEEEIEVPTAEENSDNKAHGNESLEILGLPKGTDLSKVRVNYERFKAQVDAKNEIKKELEAYKAKFGDINAPQSPQPQVQQAPQAPQPTKSQQVPQMPQAILTDADTKTIQDAINTGAMRISGMTKEDVDGLDYLEDGDPRKERWAYAHKLAESQVFGAIQQMRYQQAQQAQAQAQMLSASANSFNTFVTKEQAEPDFEAISKFATGEYFETLNDQDAQVIRASYNRIESQNATPAEIMLIQKYYSDAKAAYRAKHGANVAPKTTNKNNVRKKIEQAQAFPRSNQVEGTSGRGGGVSEATLANMLHEQNWQDIPKEYQEMLLGLK